MSRTNASLPARLLFLLLVSSVFSGCTGLRPQNEPLGDAGMRDAPATVDAPTDAPGTDAGMDGCSLPPSERPVVMHGVGGEEEIRAATTWGCDSLHVLAGNVIVAAARLTIEAGTEIRAEDGRFLLVARDASLRAAGTASRPIVMTSARTVGMRAPASWRGLILLGNGPTHAPNLTVDDSLPPSDVRGRFGGGPSAAVAGSCGELEYVRVEFAGGSGDVTDAPSAGLTLAGCGRDTVVNFIQVHRSTDGLGLVGGMPLLTHAVITRSLNQGIEWTGGFTGAMQYVVVHHPTGALGGAVRGSNSSTNPAAMPRSRPELFNMTIVGAGEVPATFSGEEMGIQFEYGSAGEVRNSIITAFPSYAVDTRSDDGASSFADGTLRVTHSLIFGNGLGLSAQLPGASAASEEEDGIDDDGGFDEAGSLLRASEENRVRDPGLTGVGPGVVACPPDPCPRFTSNFALIGDGNYATPRDARLEVAGYNGAFLRDAVGNPPDWEWTSGWTSFPPN